LRKLLSLNIKAKRKILGISQEKLAELTALSVQTINGIEGCRTWVSDKSLTTLADALGTEVFQLFAPAPEDQSENTSRLLSRVLTRIRKDILADINDDINKRFNIYLKKEKNTQRKHSQ
jgi:transcriptional regulator with XRE-family HTH domain